MMGASFFSGGAPSPITGDVPFWSPFVPDAADDSSSDYFDDASLHARWTTWDPGATSATFTETAASRLLITAPTHTNNKVVGIHQAVPAGGATRYMCTALLRGGVRQQGTGKWGIFVAGNLSGSPTTAGFHFLINHVPGFDHITRAENWAKFDTLSGTTKNATGQQPWFLGRIFVDTVANLIYTMLSVDGQVWHEFDNTSLNASGVGANPPTRWGIGLDNGNSGTDMKLAASFFRVYVASAALDRYRPCGGWVNAGTV